MTSEAATAAPGGKGDKQLRGPDDFGGWNRYQTGDRVRCPSSKCTRAIGDVPAGSVVWVRVFGRSSASTRGSYHRICRSCRSMLEVVTRVADPAGYPEPAGEGPHPLRSKLIPCHPTPKE